MAEENDPGSIRVQLSLLSAQDTQAAQQLAASLGEISKMFQALKATDFQDTAKKMGQLHAQMVRDTERLQQQQQQLMSGGGASTIDKVKGFFGRGKSDETIADNLRDTARQNRDEAARKEEERKERERVRIENLTEQQHRADQMRRAAKLPNVGEGNYMKDGKEVIPWFNRIEPLVGEPTGFRIPRFGELNAQDYFNILRDSRMKKALEAQSAGDIAGADRIGGQAARLQQVSDIVGYGYAARNLFQRAGNYMAGQGFSIRGMRDAGSALGFRRDSNALSDIFGMQTPFSQAGAEGFRQSMDIQRLRFSAGINKEQAAQIVSASAAAGFSGGARQDIATQFMGPLFRQFGVDPQNLIPFTQVLRTGTASVQDLHKELASLGETARAARLDVNAMAQALAQSGEAAQAAGGNYMSGVSFGRQFSTAYGLSPNVGNQLLQNPFVQAQLGASTGLPAFAQASLPGSVKSQALSASAKMLYRAFAGSLGTQGRRVAIKDAQGNTIGYETGANPAMAAAASQLGMNADELQKLLNGQDFGSRMGAAQSAVNAYNDAGAAMSNRSDAGLRWAHSQGYRVNAQGEVLAPMSVGSGRGSSGGIRWRVNRGLTEEMQKRSSATAMDILSGNGGAHVGWDEVAKLARQAGVSADDLKEAHGKKTIKAQVEEVRRLLGDKSAEQQAQALVAFTGPAAKFFKALVNKNGWDQFGGQPNALAASSSGPSPLSNQGNSGLSGFDTPGP
jgi:hypothetical protein